MKWIETINCRSREPLPENLVKIFQLETRGWDSVTTPHGTTYTYNYVVHALMSDGPDSELGENNEN